MLTNLIKHFKEKTMNKKNLLPLIVLLCIPFLIAGFSLENETEKEDVRKAIESYFFKGKLESDEKLLREIIHEDYRLFNVHKGRLEKYVRANFFSWLGGKNDIKFKIDYIDVTQGVAAVKVTEDAGSLMWVDYFNLVKVDGKWWIIDEVAFPLRK
jgi:hypothetical protein